MELKLLHFFYLRILKPYPDEKSDDYIFLSAVLELDNGIDDAAKVVHGRIEARSHRGRYTHGQEAYAIFLASYGDLHEDHQQRGTGEHLQPCQERWDFCGPDRMVLRKVLAALQGDGEEPPELWEVK